LRSWERSCSKQKGRSISWKANSGMLKKMPTWKHKRWAEAQWVLTAVQPLAVPKCGTALSQSKRKTWWDEISGENELRIGFVRPVFSLQSRIIRSATFPQ
jgi:hypothetical protein